MKYHITKPLYEHNLLILTIRLFVKIYVMESAICNVDGFESKPCNCNLLNVQER